MPRKTLNPGAQFNIFRASIATEFGRAVLVQLLADLSTSRTQDAYVITQIDLHLTGQNACANPEDAVRLDHLHVYDDKRELENRARLVAELFEDLSHAHSIKEGMGGRAYASATVGGAHVAQQVTNVFPDLSCNHEVTHALEAVASWLFLTRGQDETCAYLQAAVIHGMSTFGMAIAQHRSELPNGVPSSPLLGD